MYYGACKAKEEQKKNNNFTNIIIVIIFFLILIFSMYIIYKDKFSPSIIYEKVVDKLP